MQGFVEGKESARGRIGKHFDGSLRGNEVGSGAFSDRNGSAFP